MSQLPAMALPQVAPRVGEWLEEHRQSLPALAQPRVDSLAQQLPALSSQIAKLDPDGPAANAFRKLVAIELPQLIERYLNVPPVARADVSGQLVQGLRIVESEIDRMSVDLAAGSFDALATQNRYLQLKYDAGLSET